MFIVIMAGGSGKRFWPKSKEAKPKQFLPILDSKTMIQSTVERLIPLVDSDDIYYVLNYQQKDVLLEQISNIPDKNIILEPTGKNTAPCIGLAAIHLKQKNPDDVMIVLPADHFIKDEERFRESLLIAEKIAIEYDSLVTLGIKPDYPATGYGYIQCNEKIKEVSGVSIYKVKTFAEKPQYETAKQFLQSGDFLWNSGIFIWKVSTILKVIQNLLPELYSSMEKLETHINSNNYYTHLEKIYRQIRSFSIDYGVMEYAKNVSVLKCEFGWNDVGSWDEVYNLSPKDKNGNTIIENGLTMDCKNCYIDSDSDLIAVLGVDDLVVVKSENSILICKKDKTQDVKELVDKIKRKELDQYL